MKRLQAGDIDYKEATAASAICNKIEMDGIKAEQNAAVLKVRPIVLDSSFLPSHTVLQLEALARYQIK